MSFALSSSSESEDDDDRISSCLVSLARSTEFFRQFKSGRYNEQTEENWPDELPNSNHPHSNANNSMSTLVNGHQLNGSRILDSSAILNITPEDEFVLIPVGDNKYRQVRVVQNTELVRSAATPQQNPMVSVSLYFHMYNTNCARFVIC